MPNDFDFDNDDDRPRRRRREGGSAGKAFGWGFGLAAGVTAFCVAIPAALLLCFVFCCGGCTAVGVGGMAITPDESQNKDAGKPPPAKDRDERPKPKKRP